MTPNDLLLWMSARGEGSWPQFRAAIEELEIGRGSEAGDESDSDSDEGLDPFALPIYQTLRFNLQRLGHAEFFAGAGGSDWRVTPPSLAVTERPSGWHGVLVGARSMLVLERLEAAVAACGVQLKASASSGSPDHVIVSAGSAAAVAAVGTRAKLLVQFDAAAALLLSIPPVNSPFVRERRELPFGNDWRVERFSTSDYRWQGAALADARSSAIGLFRFTLRHQRSVLFCERGAAFRIPAQVGKYLALKCDVRRRNVVRYNAQINALSVPTRCRPPFLVERALIACSGVPPTNQAGCLVYAEIPHNVALIAAALLCQELR